MPGGGAGRQAGGQAGGQVGGQAGGQAGRQAGGRAGRQADGQGKQASRHEKHCMVQVMNGRIESSCTCTEYPLTNHIPCKLA